MGWRGYDWEGIMTEKKIRSAIKSIIWRILGVIILAAITYAYTRSWIITGLVAIIHHGTFLVVFYFHERIWLRIKRIKGFWRKLAKMFTYETLCGNLILGTITYLVTGSWKTMTAITLTYIGVKHVIYIFNEFLWDKIKWKKEEKMVYAYVVADLFHIGHVVFLEKVKEIAGVEGKLIVGVLTDEATMEKKPKPTIPFDERLKIVQSLKCVDESIIQETYSPLDNVNRIKPNILIESESHTEEAIEDAKKVVESYGGKVVVIPYYKGQSSTKIKNKIKNISEGLNTQVKSA